jgi:hypothetical protein
MPEPLEQIHPVDDIYFNINHPVEMTKLLIGFWERLVVLDATIIGASFTANIFLKDRLIGDGGVGYLVLAWKLLFGGIVACLIAQWLILPGLDYVLRHLNGMRVLSLLVRSEQEIPGDVLITREIRKESPLLERRGRVISKIGGFIGSVGFLLSITAYYWLYRFLQVNLHGR